MMYRIVGICALNREPSMRTAHTQCYWGQAQYFVFLIAAYLTT